MQHVYEVEGGWQDITWTTCKKVAGTWYATISICTYYALNVLDVSAVLESWFSFTPCSTLTSLPRYNKNRRVGLGVFHAPSSKRGRKQRKVGFHLQLRWMLKILHLVLSVAVCFVALFLNLAIFVCGRLTNLWESPVGTGILLFVPPIYPRPFPSAFSSRRVHRVPQLPIYAMENSAVWINIIYGRYCYVENMENYIPRSVYLFAPDWLLLGRRCSANRRFDMLSFGHGTSPSAPTSYILCLKKRLSNDSASLGTTKDAIYPWKRFWYTTKHTRVNNDK